MLAAGRPHSVTRVTTELVAERRIDSAYQALSSTTIASAAARAQRGDVAGVQALIQSVLKADDHLGRRRPQETTALLQMMDSAPRRSTAGAARPRRVDRSLRFIS